MCTYVWKVIVHGCAFIVYRIALSVVLPKGKKLQYPKSSMLAKVGNGHFELNLPSKTYI